MKRDTLTPKQEHAALLIATGKRFTEVAEIAAVSQNTLYTWKRENPLFRDRVHELRCQMTAHVVGDLTDLSLKVKPVLEKLLDDKLPSIRLRACEVILSQMLAVKNLYDLEGQNYDLDTPA